MRSTVFVAAFLLAYGGAAQAQFKIDMTDDEVRRHFNVIYMKDLAVKDIAYLYAGNLCFENGRVFVASNESPKKGPAENTIMLKVTVEPGKKLTAEVVLPTKETEKKSAIEYFLLRFFRTGFFGSGLCPDLRKNSLKGDVEFYPLLNINGHTSLRPLFDELIKER